jgi:hypothetical protein
MGRPVSSYRSHLLALHGGDLPGFHLQVSIMPNDGIGVIVLVVGDHVAPLYNGLTCHIYVDLALPDHGPGRAALPVRRAPFGGTRPTGESCLTVGSA